MVGVRVWVGVEVRVGVRVMVDVAVVVGDSVWVGDGVCVAEGATDKVAVVAVGSVEIIVGVATAELHAASRIPIKKADKI